MSWIDEIIDSVHDDRVRIYGKVTRGDRYNKTKRKLKKTFEEIEEKNKVEPKKITKDSHTNGVDLIG